jgi:hypothetical protein
MKRWFVVVLVAFVVLLWQGERLPRSWFYRQRRPTRFGRLVNSATAWLFGSVPTPFMVSLETRGRRTGRIHAVPVVVGEYEGERYLVSMLGERSGWVPNIRAAGGRAVIKHGRRQEVSLEDVPVAERAPIIKAYLRRAQGARPHIEVAHDAPVVAFEAVAHRYPVFRIEGVGQAVGVQRRD